MYLKTLFRPAINPGVTLGKALSIHTKFTDQIIILSPSFWQWYEVFVRYYSDRNVYAADNLTDELLTSTDFIVTPKAYLPSPQILSNLYAHYPHIEAGDAYIFTIKSKL